MERLLGSHYFGTVTFERLCKQIIRSITKMADPRFNSCMKCRISPGINPEINRFQKYLPQSLPLFRTLSNF